MQNCTTDRCTIETPTAFRRFLGAALVVGIIGTAFAFNGAQAGEANDDDGHHNHAEHHHAAAEHKVTRSVANYTLPDISLMRVNRSLANIRQEIDDGRPVVLNFVYTTCTAVCPMTSQTLAAFQAKLGADAAGIHVVSISIDPEHDTPERLAQYQVRYRAGPQWNFLTGTLENSIKMQKAFDTFFVDKMNHRPITYLRVAPGKAWVRLEGFASPDDLLQEYRALSSAG